MNYINLSTNIVKRVNVLCVAQWTLADKLNGLPLGLRTTTLFISHWLNKNSISCFHNSTSSDLWPLIGQNVATFPVSLISFLIPAKEYHFLSVKKIFYSSQITISWRTSKWLISDWTIIPYPVSLILLPVPCGGKYYFLFISLFRSGASSVQSWLVFWHVNIWLLPQLLKEVKPLALHFAKNPWWSDVFG